LKRLIPSDANAAGTGSTSGTSTPLSHSQQKAEVSSNSQEVIVPQFLPTLPTVPSSPRQELNIAQQPQHSSSATLSKYNSTEQSSEEGEKEESEKDVARDGSKQARDTNANKQSVRENRRFIEKKMSETGLRGLVLSIGERETGHTHTNPRQVSQATSSNSPQGSATPEKERKDSSEGKASLLRYVDEANMRLEGIEQPLSPVSQPASPTLSAVPSSPTGFDRSTSFSGLPDTDGTGSTGVRQEKVELLLNFKGQITTQPGETGFDFSPSSPLSGNAPSYATFGTQPQFNSNSRTNSVSGSQSPELSASKEKKKSKIEKTRSVIGYALMSKNVDSTQRERSATVDQLSGAQASANPSAGGGGTSGANAIAGEMVEAESVPVEMASVDKRGKGKTIDQVYFGFAISFVFHTRDQFLLFIEYLLKFFSSFCILVYFHYYCRFARFVMIVAISCIFLPVYLTCISGYLTCSI
jgi:hypothetical protein